MKKTKYLVSRATPDERMQSRENAVLTGFPKNQVLDSRDRALYVKDFVIRRIANEKIILACCTFVLSKLDGRIAWELYGVTINSSWLKWITGKAYEWPLIDMAIKQLAKDFSGVTVFWSTIQVKIVDDYKKHGWETCGEELEKDGVLYQKIFKTIE